MGPAGAGSAQPDAVRRFRRHAGEQGFTGWIGSGQEHAARFEPAHGSRLKIGDDQDLAPDEIADLLALDTSAGIDSAADQYIACATAAE